MNDIPHLLGRHIQSNSREEKKKKRNQKEEPKSPKKSKKRRNRGKKREEKQPIESNPVNQVTFHPFQNEP